MCADNPISCQTGFSFQIQGCFHQVDPFFCERDGFPLGVRDQHRLTCAFLTYLLLSPCSGRYWERWKCRLQGR